MAQPPDPRANPDFMGPHPYGGYGGELQGYGNSAPPQDLTPYDGPPLPPPMMPANYPQPQWAPQPAPVLLPVQTLPPQRPAVIGMATTMAVTASVLWVCALSFVWLVAAVGVQDLGTSGSDGVLFHLANRFHLRMLNGLAWPFYLFPLAATVAGFLVLARKQWARAVFCALGLAALAWSGWLLKVDLRWWLPVGAYILFCCAIVWTPSSNRWYAWRHPSEIQAVSSGS